SAVPAVAAMAAAACAESGVLHSGTAVHSQVSRRGRCGLHPATGEFWRWSAAVRQRVAGDTDLGSAGTDPHAVPFALCDRGAAQYPVALGRAEPHQRDRLGARLVTSRARVAAGGRLGGLRPVAQADVLLLVPAGGHPADPGCTHLGGPQPGSARSAPAAVGAAV